MASRVDDWSDGYTSDYLRDLNTYGPASANVPRPSSVVSRRVQYQPPVVQTEARTNDTPMYTEDDARGAYVAPASGYRAPAGGWDVNSSDTNLRFSNESGGKQYRVSRTQAAKKTVKKQAQTDRKQAQPDKKQAQTDKKQAQNYGSYKDQSDPLSQHILANGSPEQKPPVESVASGVQDVTDQSDMYRAIGRLSSPPSANDSQSEVRTTGGINPFESAESLAAWKQAKLRAFPLTYSDFSGGAPNAEVQRFRTIALDPNSTVADVLTAENEAYKSAAVEKVNTDNFGLLESLLLPVPGTSAGYAIKAASEGRRLYGPVAERLLAPKGPLTGGARTTLTSADEGLPVGYSLLRNPKIDTSPLAGQTSNLVQQLRAAGIPEDQIAASIARINAGAAGREAAAAGREAVAAGEQAAGREAVAAGGQAAGAGRAGEAAADGGVSKLAEAGNVGRGVAANERAAAERAGINAEIARANMEASDVFNAQLIQRIKAGTTTPDDRKVIWALMQARITPYTPASDRAVVDAARAAGIIK